MAIYEYFCPTCRNTFDQRRPMADAAVAAKCDKGHAAERTITAFATVRAGDGGAMFDMEAGPGGGCACGGACSCAG
jgi:putative FmdB family regulatory protein